MIKQWYSTTAAEFASMTDVTDEEIREASRGEVSKMTAEGEDTGDFTKIGAWKLVTLVVRGNAPR